MTTLQHAEGLRQMCDKTQFLKNRRTKLPQKLQQSYDKTCDTSLAVIQQHQARMQ